ncbi:hypothetical protein FOE78_11600 [Microlunatus elymi]|uniref:MobA-like NTP transferase domain-containing protein n=1 Tax=Microlunatus elymi TaxID=2596828 RepID=A0A516PZ67_9ACTN|nr:hypothetical protein [Microlunatus elymi]QDP96463.1 hypothetical protein FOE78_11600 [Microlunatus elymi]
MSEAAADSRWVIVLSDYRAVAPPGVDAATFAEACLTDSYEAIAAMSGVRAGLAGDSPVLEEIRWPEDVLINSDGRSALAVVDRLAAGGHDHPPTVLIMIPADVPDLPEMIIAKIARALIRADVALAPQLGGDGPAVDGLAAAGVRLPWPDWLDRDLDLDHDPYAELSDLAPRRNLVVHTPGWHRLRSPDSVCRLDPGLEGWDNLRLLLSE